MHYKTNKPRILIVDDTPLNIRILAESLSADYQIKVAPNGNAALNIIESQEQPDLILLDVMMPDMDGYEVCRRLKQNPDTKAIPIVFITAKTDVLDEELGLKLGAIDYITKPFHLSIVKARVRNHINLKLKTDLLDSLAMLDGLTNIANRRRFDEALDLEWKKSRRSNSPISLIMADIDFFKLYNDHYGHGSGDICLKKVASSLVKSTSRPTDLVARYGGEEFVAILSDTNEEGAYQIAKYFCQHVEALQIPHSHSPISDWVTISIGLSTSTAHKQGSPLILLEHADKMLYQAKETGRNRICHINV